MNYLVTGGAGFIARILLKACLSAATRLRVLDNFISGLRENIPDGVEVIEADIKDLDAIRPAFHGINGVFHIAAYPNVQFSIENPLESNAVNLTGTLNVIIAAKEAGVKRIVFAASSAAYGDQEKLPVTEDMPALPLSPYGLQKYVSEHYLRWPICFGIYKTVSLRFFNVYGPRMSFSGAYYTVIAVFLKQRAMASHDHYRRWHTNPRFYFCRGCGGRQSFGHGQPTGRQGRSDQYRFRGES